MTTKHDGGKLRMSLMPLRPLSRVLEVLEFGARKYAPHAWRQVPDASVRYLDAGCRHLLARMDGEIYDTESGLPHLAHAVCSLLFALWFDDASL